MERVNPLKIHTILLTALLAATATSVIPTAQAQENPLQDAISPGVFEPIRCIAGPQLPETPLYNIVWYCVVGDRIPEPISTLLHCHFAFMGIMQCDEDSPLRVYAEWTWDTIQDQTGYPADQCSARFDENGIMYCNFPAVIEWLITAENCTITECMDLPPSPINPKEPFLGLEPVQCLLGPHFPETPLYNIIWYCTVGNTIPEPISTLTGCRFVFLGFIQCSERSLMRQAAETFWDTMERTGYPQGCDLRFDGEGLDCQFTDLTDWATEPIPCHPDPCHIDPLTSSAAPGSPGIIKCLLGPHIPETPAYYIIWGCTAGQYLPEPIRAVTGCWFYFGIFFECQGGAVGTIENLTGCQIEWPNLRC